MDLDIQEPWQWLRSRYGETVMKTARIENGFRIRFSELQRMHVRKLQCKLAQHAVQMAFGEAGAKEPDQWEDDLQAFIQAVKDFKYMDAITQDEWDAFTLASERPLESMIIRSAMAGVSYVNQLMPAKGRKREQDDLELGRGVLLRKASIRRFLIVLFASVFLLGPMWLMILHNTLYTGLISTTVFVIVFGVLMVPYLDSETDVLSVTAAYAAVLVVFVGLIADRSER